MTVLFYECSVELLFEFQANRIRFKFRMNPFVCGLLNTDPGVDKCS